MTLNHLMVSLQSWNFEECEYPFIAVTPRSAPIWSGSYLLGLHLWVK